LFLFPSLYDNSGLVKIEAAARFTPCLFVNGSAAATGITDGVNGFLNDDNEKAFALRIMQAVSDNKAQKSRC